MEQASPNRLISALHRAVTIALVGRPLIARPARNGWLDFAPEWNPPAWMRISASDASTCGT